MLITYILDQRDGNFTSMKSQFDVLLAIDKQNKKQHSHGVKEIYENGSLFTQYLYELSEKDGQ